MSTAWAYVALGDSLLQMGHVDEAIEQLERGLAIRDENRFHMYVVAPGDAALAKAYALRLRSGRAASTAAAMRLLDRQVSRAVAVGKRFPPMRSASWLVRGLLSSLQGRSRQAIACFDEAERHAGQLNARFWQADACLERGLALCESEGRADPAARAALERALALFRACGARPREQHTLEALDRWFG